MNSDAVTAATSPAQPARCNCCFRRVALPLLVLLVIATIGAAAKIAWVNAAIARIERLGGKVSVSRSANFQGSALARWFSLLSGNDTTNVTISGKQITDADIACLGRLSNVIGLDLDNTPISDAAVGHIKRLPAIRRLSLKNSALTDAGLAEIAGMTSLDSLSISGTQITDAGLQNVEGLSNIERLELADTSITDAGLGGLAGMHRLAVLDLSRTRVTLSGIKNIDRWAQLKELTLANLRVTDESLQRLEHWPGLTFLDLSGTRTHQCGHEAPARIDAALSPGSQKHRHHGRRIGESQRNQPPDLARPQRRLRGRRRAAAAGGQPICCTWTSPLPLSTTPA